MVSNTIEILNVKNLHVQLKPGESAEELVDELEKLIKRFSEDGKWQFKYNIEL